jgi:hypothetical protein
MHEKRKDFSNAMDGYMHCLTECGTAAEESSALEKEMESGTCSGTPDEIEAKKKRFEFMKELSGEVMLRIAVLRKDMGALDQSMQMCNKIATDNFSDSIRANALCLKVLPSSFPPHLSQIHFSSPINATYHYHRDSSTR